MGSLSSGFDTKEPGGILKKLPGDDVSLTKDRLYSRGHPELNKCFIEITGTRYNGSFLLRLNKDVDESIYRTMKQIENTGGLQKRDKSLPRKGLSSVLKCLTQPVGPTDDPGNEAKPPMSVLKRTKRKFSYRPVRQLSSLRKPSPSKTELQNDKRSEHDLIGGVLDIFKSTLAQFKRSGGYATVEKGPQGREAIVLHEVESTASSTVPKEGKVRIRFRNDAFLVLQPPKPIVESQNKDEFELSIEVKPSSIARYASQTIKLAKDKVLIGIKDGEGIMQINEPPTKRSFHMSIEEDVKGKPCVKVNVTESKNRNETNFHANEMVIEGPAKSEGQEKIPVIGDAEKGKQTKVTELSSEENLHAEKFGQPDRIFMKNIPQAERPLPDFNGKQERFNQQFHNCSQFCHPEFQLPEFKNLNPCALDEIGSKLPEVVKSRDPIIVTELFTPRSQAHEENAGANNAEHESRKMNLQVEGFVTSPPITCREKQSSTLSSRFQQNEGSLSQSPRHVHSISLPPSVNGEIPVLHNSPFNKQTIECQNPYAKTGAQSGRIELSNTERRASWSTADQSMHPRPGPQWSTSGQHFYSSMKLRKEFASICHYPSNRELGESYPESLPSKFWDFCLRSRDSTDSRYVPQTFEPYGPRKNHLCSCRNKVAKFSESDEPIGLDSRPGAPTPAKIVRDVESSSAESPKEDKNAISVVNLALCGNYRNQQNGKNVRETKNKKDSTVSPHRAKWTFPKATGDPLTDARVKQVNKHHPRNRESDRARRIEALTDLSKPMVDITRKKLVYKDVRSRKPRNNISHAVQEASNSKSSKPGNTFLKAIRDINGLLGRQISRMFKLKPSNKFDNLRVRT